MARRDVERERMDETLDLPMAMGWTSACGTVTRDAKDDYLLAYAVVGRADYLVTGDDDLLALGEVERVRILSPRDFLDALQEN